MAHRGHQIALTRGEPAEFGNFTRRRKFAGIIGSETGHADNRAVWLVMPLSGKGAKGANCAGDQVDAKFFADFTLDGIACGFARINLATGQIKPWLRTDRIFAPSRNIQLAVSTTLVMAGSIWFS